MARTSASPGAASKNGREQHPSGSLPAPSPPRSVAPEPQLCVGFSEFWNQIREDWAVHHRDWTLPGFRAVAVHRMGVWLKHVRPRALRRALFVVYRTLYRYVRNHYGIELPDTTIVGRRLLIAHQGGIVIHPHAEIGDDCLIRHNVTIGGASHDRWWEAPKLGNGVQVGCGAVILGKITIGDGVRIGPNAVVMTNVPAGATVFASAPRVISLCLMTGWIALSSIPQFGLPLGLLSLHF